MSDFVHDRVCEMRFPKMYAAAVEEHEGALLYFYMERCRKELQARPQAYL